MDPLDFYDKIHGNFLLLGTPLNIVYSIYNYIYFMIDLYITCVIIPVFSYTHAYILIHIYIYIIYIHIHTDMFRSQKGALLHQVFGTSWDPQFGGKAKLMAWHTLPESRTASGNT